MTELAPSYSRADDEKIDFRWSDPRDDYLVRLRAECPPPVAVLADQDELATVVALCAWVHQLWEHSGGNDTGADDPIAIIRQARLGRSFRCVEYAAVLGGCLNAFGIRARSIALKKHDVETALSEAGHVATEAFLVHEQRWVFLDAQFNFIAFPSGVLMNAVELRAALDEQGALGAAAHRSEFAEYLEWLKPYLFYLDVRLDNRIGAPDRSDRSLMLVPVDADKPTIMQRHWLIEAMTYTHSLSTFYPTPDQATGPRLKADGGASPPTTRQAADR